MPPSLSAARPIPTTRSATSFSRLWRCTGVRNQGSNQITGLNDTTQLFVGEQVYGTGIPAGTAVTAIGGLSTISLSNNATSGTNASTALTFTASNLYLGEPISGGTIPAGAVITAITNATSTALTSVTFSGAAASATATVPITFTPTYYYEVTAVTPLGESVPTAAATSVTPNGSNLGATISWSAVPGATSYKIYRSLNAGDFAQSYLATVPAVTGTASYTYSDLGPVSLSPPSDVAAALDAATTPPSTSTLLYSTQYFYEITAVGVAGETIASSQATQTTGTGVSQMNTIDLTWNPVQGAVSYNVYRSTVSGDFNDALIGSTALASYQDLGAAATDYSPPSDSFAPPAPLTCALSAGGALAPQTTYYYAISSTGPNGESTISAYQSVTTSNAALGDLEVKLTWTAQADATGYRIYRSTTPITQADLSNNLIAIITAGSTGSYVDAGTAFTVQGTATPGSAVIADLASTNLFAPGMSVTGTDIPIGAYIVSVNSGAGTITLNANANGAGVSSGMLTFNGGTSYTPPVQTKYDVSFDLSFAGTTTSGSTTFTLTGANAAKESAYLSQYFNAVGGAGKIVVSELTSTGIQANTTVTSVNTATNQVTLSNSATLTSAAGGATLTFSTPLTYTANASADVANILSALQEMPTVGNGNVSVNADDTDTVFTVSFQNALSNEAQNLISAAVQQSTAGATVAEQTAGNGGPSYVYTVTFVGGAISRPTSPNPASSSPRQPGPRWSSIPSSARSPPAGSACRLHRLHP